MFPLVRELVREHTALILVREGIEGHRVPEDHTPRRPEPERVRVGLARVTAHPLDGIDGHGPNFRTRCLAQLQSARKAGIVTRGKLDPDQVARNVGGPLRFGDPDGLIGGDYATPAALWRG